MSKSNKSKAQNYMSTNTPATERKHRIIAALLAQGEGLTISEIGAAVGMSRQLCLYHIKKMAARAQLVLVMEPCEGNGGLQYRVWDEQVLMGTYVQRFTAPRAQVAA